MKSPLRMYPIRGAALVAVTAVAACSAMDVKATRTTDPSRENRDDTMGSTTPAAPGSDAFAGAGAAAPIVVTPVLFVPLDTNLPAGEERELGQSLGQYVSLARTFYQSLLGDTFALDTGGVHIYRSKNDSAYFNAIAGNDDSAHAMARELLAWKGETRDSSARVFVAIFVRPSSRPCGGGVTCMGGARTFNGKPGTGGGIVQMEVTSLLADTLADTASPFLSTLVHELGHSFGLTHVDCHGFPLRNNVSIMSYDPSHHSRGMTASATPGSLLPEDYFVLDQNKRAFPNFAYVAAKHNPTGRALQRIEECYLGPMNNLTPTSAAAPPLPADMRGFRLYFNGVQVGSEPDADVALARAYCSANIANHKDLQVACRYNGALFEVGYRLRWNGVDVGKEPTYSNGVAQANCALNIQSYPDKYVECYYEGARFAASPR